MDNAEVREKVTRVEALLEAVRDDPAAVEALQGVVELYGEALRRVVEGADPVEDELLSHLLILHDLHPTERFPDKPAGPVQPQKLLQVGTLR